DLTWSTVGAPTSPLTHVGTIFPARPDSDFSSPACYYLNAGTTTDSATADTPGHLHLRWSNSQYRQSCGSGVLLGLQLASSALPDSTWLQLNSLQLIDSSGVAFDLSQLNLGTMACLVRPVCDSATYQCCAASPNFSDTAYQDVHVGAGSFPTGPVAVVTCWPL